MKKKRVPVTRSGPAQVAHSRSFWAKHALARGA